jgi:hypothetical protein
MQVRGHAGDAAGKNLAAFGDEFFQKIGILVIDCFNGDVDPAPGHGPIGATKSGTAFGGLWLHRELLGFAVKRVFSQERIVLFLFQPVRRLRTFLVSRRHVTRDRFAERFRFSAFESDDFLGHDD